MAISESGPIEPAALPFSARLLGRLRPRRRTTKYKRDEVIMGYLFVLVPMAIFITFFLGAMAFDFVISFFHWAILDSPRFVGSGNYNYIFRTDPAFWTSIWNTVEYALIVVPLQTIIAFFLALTVNQNISGKKFFRTTFYFPSITSSVAISLIFLFIFNNYGLLNTLLGNLHIGGLNWLGDPHIALKSIMGLNIWTTTGTLMVVFLAALQDVPRDVLEAAAIDGATGIQAVLRVVVPLIRPAAFFVVANGIIGSLQVFDQAFIMSQGTGGPENATLTAVLYTYNNAFQNDFYGVAAASSFFLFAVIFSATIILRRVIGEEAA